MSDDLEFAAVLLLVLAAVALAALIAEICLAGRTPPRPARHRPSTAERGGRATVERPGTVLSSAAGPRTRGGWCSPAIRPGPPT